MTNPTDAEKMREMAAKAVERNKRYWEDAASEIRALPLPNPARTYEDGVRDAAVAMGMPMTEAERIEGFASILGAWWSESSAQYVRAGKISRDEIKGIYALRDFVQSMMQQRYAAILALIKDPDNG